MNAKIIQYYVNVEQIIMISVYSFCALLASLAFYHFNLPLPATVCMAIVFISLILFYKSDKYKYPPGPVGLPILGSIPWLAFKDPAKYYVELKEKYGDMFTIKIGPIKNIVINDYETIKEFSNHPDFQDRPKDGIISELFEGYGLLDSEGEHWKHQRRFMLHNLKDFGMGRLNMQDKVIDEFQHTVSEMKKADGKPMSMDIILQKATCNIIFNLAFNKRFDYNDPDFILRLESLNMFMEGLSKTFLMSLFPKLRFTAQKYINQMVSSNNGFIAQSEDFIKNHKEDYDENNPRDLIDLFLMEMKKSLNDESQTYLSTFTEKQLKSLIADLFIAGTETTSTTLRWALVYLLHHPEIQQKVHAEIDEVVGHERPISTEDKSKLPFTLATLQEAERLGSLAPWGIPRSNSKPAEFKGYKFPPRCVYLLNLYGLHRDKKLWKNPEKFDPTRFIDSNGKTFRPPYLMPFGSGKRNCAGESLARMETFLLFATLMQNFKFTPVGKDLPSFKTDTGIFRCPKPYSICAKSRY